MTAESQSGWFSELAPDQGSAFSIKLESPSIHLQCGQHQIEIAQTEQWGQLLIVDGQCRLSSRDQFIYHEMLAHLALFAHPQPHRVVIIGGSDGGLSREIRKHDSITHIWQLEPDTLLAETCRQAFDTDPTDDPRLQRESAEALAWLHSQAPGTLDIIVLDPTTVSTMVEPALLEACLHALDDEGVLVVPAGSPLFHDQSLIKPTYHQLGLAGADNRHLVTFPLPSRSGGLWCCYLASKQLDVTSFRIEDAAVTELGCRYYNAEMHASALGIPQFLRQLLQLDE